MRTHFLSYIFILLASILSSCADSQTVMDDSPKATANISQYMTVNKYLQWELSISKEKACSLGISQEQYNQALSNIKQTNEQIEIAKTDTNTTVILCLTDKQISINKGKVEIIDNHITRNAEDCMAHNNFWVHHYLAASIKRINNYGGVSFFTAQPQHSICVQVNAYVDSGYFLGGWSCYVMNDVTKETWFVSGSSTRTHFTKEMGSLPEPIPDRHHWNIGCSVSYPSACFIDLSCYTSTPYQQNG